MRPVLRACFVLFGLLALSSPADAADRNTSPARDAPIRVGVLYSLTGTMAISFKSLVDATKLAIDQVNDHGGVLGRRLVPVIKDGASKKKVYKRRAKTLITEESVVSIFGCWTSSSRKAVRKVVEARDHLLWYPVQYEGGERSPNVIYTGATPNQQILPAVDWCVRRFGERIYLVGSDYVFPRTAHELIRRHLEQYGAEPVGEAYRPLGDTSFDAVVKEIRATDPDVVFNTINGDSNIAFFKALAGADLDVPVMSVSIAEGEIRSIREETGPEALTGHYCAWNYFQKVNTSANRRFVAAFKERYGSDRVTSDPIASAYTQVHLFARAAEKAGSTEPAAIREAARGLIHDAPGGLIRIDPDNQHTWEPARIGRIRPTGQIRVVWTSKDPLPPRPYLPETFLTKAKEQGRLMDEALADMMDRELSRGDGPRKRVLAAMTAARGRLGSLREAFAHAALDVRPDHRRAYAAAWAAFVRRAAELSKRRTSLTDAQRVAHERFRAAKKAFGANARRMLEALYRTGEGEQAGATP